MQMPPTNQPPTQSFAPRLILTKQTNQGRKQTKYQQKINNLLCNILVAGGFCYVAAFWPAFLYKQIFIILEKQMQIHEMWKGLKCWELYVIL